MALPQDRYINISSTASNSASTERDLQTLLITDDSSTDSGTTFDTSTILKFYNSASVGKVFGTSSKTYLWAVKYFSYVSPAGEVPSRLTIAKSTHTAYAAWSASTTYNTGDKVTKDSAYYECLEDGTTGTWDGDKWTAASPYVDDFTRISGISNDFGVFTFLTNPMPAASDVKLIGAANAALNYRYLFVTSMTNADVTSATTVAAAKTALAGASGTKGEEITYQKSIDVSSATKVIPKTYIVAAVMSAIDWDNADGSVNPMFRQISGETADVVSELPVTGTDASRGADELDAANVDYYGQVQTNGLEQSFFQRGFNSDGESTLVYFGEMWLKSQISSKLMNLFLNSNKIPANQDGTARIFTVIDSVCNDALNNGVIESGKTLDSTARVNVLAWTGNDSTAITSIEENGYWLKAWIVESDDGKGYVAKYTLIYGKGDVIVKVDGADIAL